jgi:DNA repair protein RadC
VEVGYRLLKKIGGISGQHRTPIKELMEQHAIGEAKAAQIKAAIELGRRLWPESPEEHASINSPADALVLYEISALEQEHLRVILLDRRNRVLETVEVYQMFRKAPCFSSRDVRNGFAFIIQRLVV